MSSDCLILNGNGKPLSYFPLSAVDWKTAVKLVFTRNVIVIKEHDDWEVRSPWRSYFPIIMLFDNNNVSSKY